MQRSRQPVQAVVYEIECHERAGQAGKLIHPILKRGHSNACEASHNVLIRFRSKAIALERLHYTLSSPTAIQLDVHACKAWY